LLELGRSEEAARANRRALELDPYDIRGAEGLVQSLLVNGRRFGEAVAAAKVTLKRMPRSARALSLFGQVLRHSREGANAAAAAFQKALALDKHCLEAVLSLAQLHVGKKSVGHILKTRFCTLFTSNYSGKKQRVSWKITFHIKTKNFYIRNLAMFT
jgi:tetratricopeptide (TPR) repeat protein